MAAADATMVSRLLREFGGYSALQGGNPYRAKAYARAADSLAAVAVPLEMLVREGRLTEIPGVDQAIADIITKLHRTGTHPKLEAMRKDIPTGVLEMLAVPGLRPEKVLKLYRELGIASLSNLEAAAQADRLKCVKGLGPALQAKILRNIAISRETEGCRHIHRAAALLENAAQNLRRARPELKRVTPAGESRRGCELVRDLVLVAEGPSLEDTSATMRSGELSVVLTDESHYGVSLLHATGSARHLTELCKLAKAKGMVLAHDGLQKGGEIVAAKTERDIYRSLDLPFIPPELREGRNEIELHRNKGCQNLLQTKTSAASCTLTPTCPTAGTRSRLWSRPPVPMGISTSEWPIIRNLRITQAASR